MGDTANWEFAAAVAAVVMGLGGLLLFTLVATIGSWRMAAQASRASAEAARASQSVQELARYLSSRSAQQLPIIDLREEADELADLRRQADLLIDQQARLQDAVRSLVESGALGATSSERQLRDLDGMIRRLEDNLARVAAAVNQIDARGKTGD
jgi:methyl-accepting chemotaxis protein